MSATPAPQTVTLQPGQSITITAAAAATSPPTPPVTPPAPPVTPPPTTPPVSPPAGSNEPAGMTTVFNTGPIASWAQSKLIMIGGTQPGIVPDGSGFRVTYLPSLAGGNSPGQFGTGDFASAGTGTGYFRYKSRYSPGFSVNGNVDVKQFEPHTFQQGPGPGQENHILAAWANSNTSLAPLIGLQGPYTTSNIHPSPATNIADGAWHLLEWLLIQGSPGTANGSAKVWVDGNAVINDPAVLWLGTGNQVGWKAFVCDPTFGGGTASPPASQSWDADALYISVK